METLKQQEEIQWSYLVEGLSTTTYFKRGKGSMDAINGCRFVVNTK